MVKTNLLTIAAEIAKEAGKEILKVYERSGNIDVTIKADDSPLTEADQRAHQPIVAGLTQQTPDIPVLSEESKLAGFNERGQWRTYWLVDPLDGTKEFIKRNGEFTVNIALIENHRPTLGVVHVPVTGVTYQGQVGQGASRQDADGALHPIGCRKISPGQPGLGIVASRHHRGAELDSLIETLRRKFPDVELLSMGSSLKICLVAEGKADLYPRLAPTCEWDTAAAHAVLAAAGGVLVDTGFNELRYNTKEELLNPYFIAIADSSYPWQKAMELGKAT